MTAELKEMRTLGRRVRSLRRASGLTKRALARSTGLTAATISRIEKADETGYNPHLDTLAYIADGLGVKVGELTNRGILMVL